MVANATPNITHYGTLAAASDARLKQDVQDASLSECQTIVDAIVPKTYQRTDQESDKHRLGFIAQDLLANLPSSGKFQNLVTTFMHGEVGSEQEMYGVDYSRLAACVLWGVCKNQQTALKSLTARVEALEAQTKRPTKKSTKVNSDAL